MSHCNEMICQQVTLSGYAEGPKVADTVIEARAPAQSPVALWRWSQLCPMGLPQLHLGPHRRATRSAHQWQAQRLQGVWPHRLSKYGRGPHL